MLSGKLIRLIESHADAISAGVSATIQRDPRLAHLARSPEPEILEESRAILADIGHWLQRGNEEKLARKYENVARARLASVPLQESIRGFLLIKDKIMEFIDYQAIDRDCVQLCAEEQFERQVGRLFDVLVLHLANGYETEWRHVARPAA
jgi:hypothetical protein